MSLRYGERPLSDCRTEDQRRLERRELDRICAMHAANYAAHQLVAEAERLNPIEETLS